MPKNTTPPRPKVQAYCTPEELEKFRNAAESEYLTLSAWVLQTLHKAADDVMSSQQREIDRIMVSLYKRWFPDEPAPTVDQIDQLSDRYRSIATDFVLARRAVSTDEDLSGFET